MHIKAVSNGFGAPSMYLLAIAREIGANISISADTGWENDCLLSTGERVTARYFFDNVIVPLAEEMGIQAAFVRTKNKAGQELPPIPEVIKPGRVPIPLFGSNGGRLGQSCTEKWKIRGIRQCLRSLKAQTATTYLGLTMDELHRMKPSDMKWHQHEYPLIDRKLYKSGIQERLNKMGIPFMVSSQCDGCPHKNLWRWQNSTPETIQNVADLEKSLIDDGLFFNELRIPLNDALAKMESRKPLETLFDSCDSGYCFT